MDSGLLGTAEAMAGEGYLPGAAANILADYIQQVLSGKALGRPTRDNLVAVLEWVQHRLEDPTTRIKL